MVTEYIKKGKITNFSRRKKYVFKNKLKRKDRIKLNQENSHGCFQLRKKHLL